MGGGGAYVRPVPRCAVACLRHITGGGFPEVYPSSVLGLLEVLRALEMLGLLWMLGVLYMPGSPGVPREFRLQIVGAS